MTYRYTKIIHMGNEPAWHTNVIIIILYHTEPLQLQVEEEMRFDVL